MRALADAALARFDAKSASFCSPTGRPSIAPEMLLRAPLLQAFYSARSERHLMEQMDHNPPFRWCVGPPVDASVWRGGVFAHNRDRAMEAQTTGM